MPPSKKTPGRTARAASAFSLTRKQPKLTKAKNLTAKYRTIKTQRPISPPKPDLIQMAIDKLEKKIQDVETVNAWVYLDSYIEADPNFNVEINEQERDKYTPEIRNAMAKLGYEVIDYHEGYGEVGVYFGIKGVDKSFLKFDTKQQYEDYAFWKRHPEQIYSGPRVIKWRR